MGSRLLRVPFVQRCFIQYDDGEVTTAFIVNINTFGAYLAGAEMPVLGRTLRCRFRIPGNETEVNVHAEVAWLNPRQQHPVHSLPPGFGVKFVDMGPQDVARIEGLMYDYRARRSGAGR